MREPPCWGPCPALSASWGPRVRAATASRIAVSPIPSTLPPTTPSYEIVPVNPCFPVVDDAVTIKSLLFSPSKRKRVNSFYRRYRLAIIASFFVGLLSVGVGGMASINIARPAAVVSCVSMMPGQLSYILEMRADFIKLIIRSFEFWYTTTLIVLWGVSGATMYSDIRICTLFMPCLGMELQLLGDACTLLKNSFLVSAFISIGISSTFMTYAAFGLIDHIVLFQFTASRDGRLVVSNRDIFINTTLPLIILGTRLFYNKYRALRHTNKTYIWKDAAPLTALRSVSPTTIAPIGRVTITRGVRCMVVRCKLKLQLYAGAPYGHSRQALDPEVASRLGSRLLSLRAVRVRELFFISDTIIPWLTPQNHVKILVRVLFQITGLIGLLGSVSCFFTKVGEATDFVRMAVALSCSTTYCGYFFCVSHRRLLLRLFRSFDFVFALVQLTLELVAIALLYSWQATASLGGVLPWWMWMWHVLTLDAITPHVKQQLGLRIRYFVSPVVAIFMVGQVWLVAELLVFNHPGFEDHDIVRVNLGDKRFKLKAASFALSRAIASFVWCCRVLWRIWCSPDGFDSSLVMLQGLVEFDYCHRDRLRSSQTALDI